MLTHGFTVDGDGRKMSKSLGNIIPANQAMKDLGADVLRLYVSAADYRSEISASDEIFKRTADAYRGSAIRRIFCSLISPVLSPRRMRCPSMNCCHWIGGFSTSRVLATRDKDRLRRLSVPPRVPPCAQLCSGELGGFYLDIIKDRQYTTGADSLPRRSAQTALCHLAEALCRWIAPDFEFYC